MKSNLLPIAYEGFRYILYSIAAFMIFWAFDFEFLALTSAILVFVFMFIYRNPEREVVIFEPNSVLSPVDGVVASIQEIKDERYGYKIAVESGCLNVSVLRVPFDSTLSEVTVKKGARLSEKSSIFKVLNENIELTFSATPSNFLKVRHVLTQSLLSFEVNVKKSQTLRKAARYGVLPNGVTEIYIPRNFRLNVNLGDKLIASESLVGYFVSLP